MTEQLYMSKASSVRVCFKKYDVKIKSFTLTLSFTGKFHQPF